MYLQRKHSDSCVDDVSLFIKLSINKREMLQAGRRSDEDADKVREQAYALGESISVIFSDNIEVMFGKNSVDMPNFSVMDFDRANEDADTQLYEFVFIVQGSHELNFTQIREVHDLIMTIAKKATEGTTNIVHSARLRAFSRSDLQKQRSTRQADKKKGR